MTSTAITTDIPARLDRLPWTRWHWMVVFALGITWILDGLEVTIVGALSAVLTHPLTLHLSESQIGLSASAYLAGSVGGALIFSYFIDRQGRKRWFIVTLLLYLCATTLTAFSWNFWSFALCRFLTGAGIGGEYSAINSAIDELIPARVRGHVDLAINGSWWVGTAAGALLTIPLLDPSIVPEHLGWRLCFGLGAMLGFAIILTRRFVPESPRWLMTHGRTAEAEAIVTAIETAVLHHSGGSALPAARSSITIYPRRVSIGMLVRELVQHYPKRVVLGLALMVSQSFLYNAIFFTYALVLTRFYQIPAHAIGLYILPFAVGNFLGPLLLGRLFDTRGRRTMISLCYGLSGILLACSGWLFWQGYLTALTQTIAWSVIFFFASAGASAAYLTVSEIFPLEIRALSIGFFFIVAQGAGVLAPWIFARLIETSPKSVFYGDLIGAGFMLLGALVELCLGVNAEGRSLEDIAPPITSRLEN